MPRRIIVFIASSLDGFIAGPHGEIDWLFTDQDYGYKEFYASVDTLLAGRKTYELANTFPEWPYTGKEVFVFSRHPQKEKDARVKFETDPVPFVKKLREISGKNIWLVGGGEIVSLLLDAGLIDELRVFVHPIVLGKGIRLFPFGTAQAKLELMDSHAFGSGLVELRYRVKR
ncbi:MAG: dihydrofolate reductase family protein [Candidatus Diapherotrites archaeon]|nr:dihydrofolate reductase family protein [Candidatus Diapherotrites archaeon]